jgi:hypothetical protein
LLKRKQEYFKGTSSLSAKLQIRIRRGSNLAKLSGNDDNVKKENNEKRKYCFPDKGIVEMEVKTIMKSYLCRYDYCDYFSKTDIVLI